MLISFLRRLKSMCNFYINKFDTRSKGFAYLESKRQNVSIPLCNPHRRRSAATGEYESGEGSTGMLNIAHCVF